MAKGNPIVELKSNRVDNYFNYTLRDARVEAGYTMKELAALVGVSIPAICGYERLRAVPEDLIAKRIAIVLNERLRRTDCIDDYFKKLFPEHLHNMIYEIRKEREYSPDTSDDALDYAVLLMEDTEVLPIQGNQIREAQESDLKDRLQRVLKTLSYREREIIKLRYGLEDGYLCTHEEVEHIFRIPRENKANRSKSYKKIATT